MTDWDLKFEEHNAEDPRLYVMFKVFAAELIRAGRKRISHGTIVERIRWETAIRSKLGDFKVNQNFGRPMAEKFIRDHPEYDGIFEFRKRKPTEEAYEEVHDCS